MFRFNRFNSRIFNFEKKTISYDTALAYAGINLSQNTSNIVNPIYYDYSSYIVSFV